jgi:hypothetical protein
MAKWIHAEMLQKGAKILDPLGPENAELLRVALKCTLPFNAVNPPL